MRILIISTVYPRWKKPIPGEKVHGKFVHDLAKKYVENGNKVHVLTPHSYNTKKHDITDGVNIHRFHYFISNKYETLTYGPGIPENIKKLKNKLIFPCFAINLLLNAIKIIYNYEINFINAHWAVPTGYLGVWLKKLTRKKLIITMYGAELFPVLQGKMTFLKPFIKTAINNADVVAGISQATVDAAKELSDRKDIHLIPDGIDIAYYKPGEKNIEILKKYNCYGKKVIFFTGRMVERKGHRHLLEAMRHVTKEIEDSKLILGGSGPLHEEIVNLRKIWKLEEYVELPGFIPEQDMVPLLQSADLYVLPSCIDKNGDTEGSATAALEAMACGTPAIISKVGGNIGAIKGGEGAYYCEPANGQDLAEKISFLFNKKGKSISEKAIVYIQNNFTWNVSISKYENKIKKLYD